MATTKKQTSRRAPSHALFWTLLKEVPGYDPHYKDVIKEGIVHEHSRGRTTSLSEMYAKYPREYSLMIEAMKGTPQQKKTRYDSQENNARRRVIAAISKWVDKLGYSFESREAKVRYVIGIAYLRREYVKYKNQLTINNGQLTIINQHSKTKKNGRLK